MYTLEDVLGLLGWIFGGAVALKAGISAIVDIIKVFKAPNDAQDKEIQELKEHRKHVDECLEKDKDALADLRGAINVMIRAQFAVIGHGLDGNNVKEMKESQEELHDYLIKRK